MQRSLAIIFLLDRYNYKEVSKLKGRNFKVIGNCLCVVCVWNRLYWRGHEFVVLVLMTHCHSEIKGLLNVTKYALICYTTPDFQYISVSRGIPVYQSHFSFLDYSDSAISVLVGNCDNSSVPKYATHLFILICCKLWHKQWLLCMYKNCTNYCNHRHWNSGGSCPF